MQGRSSSIRFVWFAALAGTFGCAGDPFLYAPDDGGETIFGSIADNADDDDGQGGSTSPPTAQRTSSSDKCGTSDDPCLTGICDGSACRMAKDCAQLAEERPDLPSGMVWLDVDGSQPLPPIEVFCDMETAGGGFARVMRVELGAACSLSTGATAQLPEDETATCAKLSDELINHLSPNRVFYSVVDGKPPLFTRYEGAISSDAAPGRVTSHLSFEALAQPEHEVTYQYWKLFHQHDFYDPDGCAGAAPDAVRLAMEYASNGYVYAVTGDCATLGTNVTGVRAEVFVR